MIDEKPALLREFTLKGLWWFPGNPGKKFWGTLNYSPYDGAVLELMGDLENSLRSPPLILGMALNGKPITLYKCYERGKTGHSSDSTLTVSEYFINIVFSGIHFEKVKDIEFIKISVHYSNLDEWLNIPIFNKHYGVYEFHIKYQPKLMHVTLNNDWRISINIIPQIEESFGSFVRFKQISFVDFEPSIRRPFEDYLVMLRSFQNLLSFGVMEPTYPLIVKGEIWPDESNKANDNMTSIEILNSDVFHEIIYKVQYISRSKMLFNFKDIESNYEMIFRNWYVKSEQIKLCFDLFFSTLYNPHLYIEHEFITLYQSIESYLRHKIGKKPNMKKVMIELIDKHSLVIGNIIEKKEQLVDKIIRTRQYLIHSGHQKESGIVKGGELRPINEKIRMLFIACLLVEVGFSQQDAKKFFSKNVRIKRLSELELMKWD